MTRARAARLARRAVTSRVLREAVGISSLYVVYALVRGAAIGDEQIAFRNARAVIRWEQALGIYWEPEIQRAFADLPVLVTLADWFYWLAHFPLLLVFAVWMYWFHRDRYPLFRNVFIISALIGMTIFYLWPLMPPRLLPESYGFIVPEDGAAISYHGIGPFANDYAAMPSMHFAWATLMAIGFVRLSTYPAVRVAGALLPIVNLWAIVVTANHFVLDAVGGVAVLGVAFAIALALPSLTQWTRTAASRTPLTRNRIEAGAGPFPQRRKGRRRWTVRTNRDHTEERGGTDEEGRR